VEPVLGRDDDLAVDHALSREGRAEAGFQLREVAIEWAQVTALDVEAVPIAEHDRPEAVPLGLEEPAVSRRQLGRELGEHRLAGRLDRKPGHPRPPARRAAIRPSADFHPASNGWPGSSRSITSGAWSDGTGFPFRASRSISAHTVRAVTGRVTSR